MFFSFYTPKDFSFFTTIGILSHKAARRSTDQSSRSSSDISALPTIDDSRLPRRALRRRSGIDGFVIFGIRQYHPAT